MRVRSVAVAVVVFVCGIAVGYAAKRVEPSVFRGKSKEEAGKALLEQARAQAGREAGSASPSAASTTSRA